MITTTRTSVFVILSILLFACSRNELETQFGPADSVRVLTFNVWGLPSVSGLKLGANRSERLQAICRELQTMAWDVVFLQEVWIATDRVYLRSCGYRNYTDLDEAGRLLDSGLLILSKYPLKAGAKMSYPPLSDMTRAFEDGEAFARKSAILAKVAHPNGEFWVANTHLVARYDANDLYLEDRRRQLKLFTQWAISRAAGEPLIVGGDLNITPSEVLWKELDVVLPGFKGDPETGAACTICPPNTNQTANGGKVDHLFGSPYWRAVSGKQAMTVTIPVNGTNINLSDHFGWETLFARNP